MVVNGLRNVRGLPKLVGAFVTGFALLWAGLAYAQNADRYDLLIDVDDTFTVVVGDPPNQTIETVDSTALPAGAVARLKFRVSNNGPLASPATTVAIEVDGSISGALAFLDDVPADSFGANGEISGCTYAAPILTCQVPALDAPVESPAGSGVFPATFAEVIVDYQTTVAETLQIAAEVPLGPDAPNGERQDTCDPNGVCNNDLTEITTVLAGVDLFVEWDAPASVPNGSFFDWTVRVRNVGPNTADSYRLSIPVPTGVINITPPAGCTLVNNGAQDNFVCDVTTPIDPGSETGPFVPFTFNGQLAATAGSTIGTTVNVDNSSPDDPNPLNDEDSFMLTVSEGLDVFARKERAPSQGGLFVGDTVTFTIGAGFVGDTPTSITLSDSLPSQYSIISVDPGNYDCGTPLPTGTDPVICTATGAGDGDPDGDGVFDYGNVIITALIVSESDPDGTGFTPTTNTATVTPVGSVEANTGNNSASDGPVVIRTPVADLSVTKTTPSADAVEGQNYTFRLRALNLGTTAFTAPVVITDILPAGVSFTGSSGTGWSCDAFDPADTSNTTPLSLPAPGPVNVVCTNNRDVPALAQTNANTARTPELRINVTPDDIPAGTTLRLQNSATVNGGDGVGNDTSNDSITIDFDIVDRSLAADVGIAKTSGVPATDVNGDITLPLTLTSNTTATAGEPYAFEITLSNSDPIDALDVEVRDTITNLVNGNTDFVSIFVDGVSQTTNNDSDMCRQDSRSSSSARLACRVDVPANCTTDCPVIQVVVIPGRDEGRGGSNGTTRSNQATFFPTTTPDANGSNNSSTVNFPFVPRSDVTVTKQAPQTATTGVDLTYTITAQNLNNGLSRADGVRITDTLPLNMRFISASVGNPPVPADCSGMTPGTITSASDRTIVCEMGNLNIGAQELATIVIRPEFGAFDQADGATNVIRNDVRVDLFDSSDNIVTVPFDVNPDNNDDFVETTLSEPNVDLSVDKSDSADPLAVGDNFTYTVEVDNLGPSAAHNVRIVDTWPNSPNIELLGVAPPFDTACTFASPLPTPGEITCDIGYMEANTDVSIVFNVIARQSGTVSNSVAVFSDELFDVLPDVDGATDPDTDFDREILNNETEEESTILSRTDVILESKTASQATVSLLDEFDYVAVVTVSNEFGEADDVVFLDELPEGMELTGVPVAVLTLAGNATGSEIVGSCDGVAGDTEFECELATLNPLDRVEITIPVRVTEIVVDDAGTPVAEPQQFTNEASVSTSSIERGDARDNNDESGPVSVQWSSISGNVFRDFLNNTTKDTPTDTDVAGVPITLTGTVDGNPIDPITINTDANGNFEFPYLPDGTYTVSRGTPPEDDLADGVNTPGQIDGSPPADPSGTVDGNTITTIVLGDNEDHINNIFRLIPQAQIGLAKDGVITQQNVDGSFEATYSLVVANLSRLEPLSGVSVADTLDDLVDGLGAYSATLPLSAGQYSVTTAPSGTCSGSPRNGVMNANFNGDDQTTIVDQIALDIGESCTVTFGVTVFPSTTRFSDEFDNQASTSGTGTLSNQNPTDVSDDGTDPDTPDSDPTTVQPTTSAGITITKTGALTGLDFPLEEGDDITYTFVVRNTGSLTLTNVEIRDPLIQGEANPTDALITIASLDPGEANEVTRTATYAMTLPDLNAGEVNNTADVIGTDPFGRTPTDDDSTTTLLVQAPELDLVKTAVISGDPNRTEIGDVITYTFTITNTGNVTATNVVLADPLDRIVFPAGALDPIATLDPGAANAVTRTATYTIDQEDIDAGQVVNRATVTGRDPEDNEVRDESGPTPGTDEDTIVDLARVPGLETVKTQEFVDNGDGIDSTGDTINYTITVENIGNVPVTGITLDDTLTAINTTTELPLTDGPDFDENSGTSPQGTLAPGEIATYTASFLINLDAVIAGGVSNTATATGVAFDGSGPPDTPVEVSDRSDDDDDNDGDTTDDPTEYLLSPFISSSGLSITKTTPLLNVNRGDVVPYEITVTNENTFVEGEFDLVDTLPNGMIYIPGSATIDGDPADVEFIAGRVTWPDVIVPPLGTTVVTLEARILNSARGGDLVNTASLLSADTGERVIPDARAIVRIPVEPVFECTDVVGKVFNDVNGNGYQDDPSTVARGITDQTYDGGKGKLAVAEAEPRDEGGIPGVRIAMADGTIITTDENGLYSVPCAALPQTSGSNFILKVDERSLPAGYRMTTENPRVMPVTPGTMTEMNFGASVALPVVRVDLSMASFVQTDEGVVMSPALQNGLRGVLQEIAGSPSTMMLTMHVASDASEADVAMARRLLDMVERQVSDDWSDIGRVRLRIEQSIARAQ